MTQRVLRLRKTLLAGSIASLAIWGVSAVFGFGWVWPAYASGGFIGLHILHWYIRSLLETNVALSMMMKLELDTAIDSVIRETLAEQAKSKTATAVPAKSATVN